MNFSAEEKRDWILKYCRLENGGIDLTDLDFSGYDVYLYGLKANMINQSNQEAEVIFQNENIAQKIYQEGHICDYVTEGRHNKSNEEIQ